MRNRMALAMNYFFLVSHSLVKKHGLGITEHCHVMCVDVHSIILYTHGTAEICTRLPQEQEIKQVRRSRKHCFNESNWYEGKLWS